MNRKQRTGLAAAALVALSGCASIFNGQTQAVTINSVPAGATVTVTNRAGQAVHTAVTPATVQLKRGAGYFKSESYSVAFKKDGFADGNAVLDSSVSGWYIGNLVFGGLIGMLGVDPATGAMYTFPDSATATLAPGVGTAAPAVGMAAPAVAGGAQQPLGVTGARAGNSPRVGVYVVAAEQAGSTMRCAASPAAHMVDSGPTFERFAMSCDNGSALVLRCTSGGCRRE